MYKQKSYREGFTDPLPREGLMMNRMAVLRQNEGGIVSVLHQNEGGIVSVLYQNEGGIRKLIPNISRVEGNLKGFPIPPEF